MIYHGNCLDVLRTLNDNSVDSVVTDPPYGLSFMGKKWDYDVPTVEVWAECLRVLKPGGHLLAFAGTRTQHRMAVRIEDAGFEIRDMIAWVYGSGFPKSLNVAKAIESGGGRPEDIRRMQMGDAYAPSKRGRVNYDHGSGSAMDAGAADWEPATDAARQWQGWGTALKPAMEPITVARKPLIGTVADNVLAHGTGAINVDGCRVATDDTWKPSTRCASDSIGTFKTGERTTEQHAAGRWPANLIHDGSEEVLNAFPDAPGQQRAVGPEHGKKPSVNVYGDMGARPHTPPRADTGSAARFFYCAKASKKDRNEGLDDMPDAILARSCQAAADAARGNVVVESGGAFNKARVVKNNHPTVKPTELMRYLCRLVTPAGGVVLDPFAGSGSTGKAAVLEGFRFIGIEREPEYAAIATARIEKAFLDYILK